MYDMIKRDIFDSFTDVVDSLFNKCNKSERIGESPVRVRKSFSRIFKYLKFCFNIISYQI